MTNITQNFIKGYKDFQRKYYSSSQLMHNLYTKGQNPKTMIVGCSDSRVDPAIILQCDPGDLFVVRNVANIIPPYQADTFYHGTSAALEYGICYLKVNSLIILGHSNCGGVNVLFNKHLKQKDDFISQWMSIVEEKNKNITSLEEYIKLSLKTSLHNSMTFPWIKSKVLNKELNLYLWYFDIKSGDIHQYHVDKDVFYHIDQSF